MLTKALSPPSSRTRTGACQRLSCSNIIFVEVTEPWLWAALSRAGSSPFTGWFCITSRSPSQPHPSLMLQLFCRTHWPPRTGTRKQWTGLLNTLSQKEPGQPPVLSYPEFRAVCTCSLKQLGPGFALLGPFRSFSKNKFLFLYLLPGAVRAPDPQRIPLPSALPCANLPPHCPCSSEYTKSFKGLLTAIVPLIAGP